MRLLIKTYSCHPWTRGEILTDREIDYKVVVCQIFARICRHLAIVIDLVGYVVLIDNTLFPNFKEEINV